MATRASLPLHERLAGVVGADHVLTDAEDLRFYATDVFRAGKPLLAVVRPGSVAEVQEVVRIAREAHAPIVVRGGGASYTDGYTPGATRGISLSTERLTSISVNEEDRTVTAEAGVTWAALDSALRPRGWRTPFFGPFSGLRATVGGALSQHAVSHGTGAFGLSAESLLTLEVVTGTGELLATGSLGSAAASPFFRHYGPDLAGLFTGDCGALGIKVRATLRLVRRQTAAAYLSFRFETFEALHAAMRSASAEHLDDTHFAIDREITRGQLARQDRLEGRLGAVKSVLGAAGSLREGAASLVRLARTGASDDLATAPYAAHYVIEAASDAEAQARADRLRAILSAHGTEIAAAVPNLTRAQPFPPLLALLGAEGERWVPVHGILPHSRVAGFHAALQAWFADNREAMETHGIRSGTMFLCVGPTGFLYEPTLTWPDARSIYHEREMPADWLQKLPRHPENPAAFAEVKRMKSEIAALMDRHGAAHFQIGRFYNWAGGRNRAAIALIRAIKAELDPANLLAPGVLGL
ncbi:MAG: FAD-binding oxidoreductase [Sphingomonadaceae bacterium]